MPAKRIRTIFANLLIHVSAFEEVFHWFVETCLKYNVQAFITTHSAEAIDAMLEVTRGFYTDNDPLKIITMRKSCKSNATLPQLVPLEVYIS